MLGVEALLKSMQPRKTVILTVDGMIARSENRAMVELMPIRWFRSKPWTVDPETAVVMVDRSPTPGGGSARPQCHKS